MYKLIIVDDEDIVCKGLRSFIDWNSLGYEIIQICNCVSDVLNYISTHSVNVILSDIIMPGETGLDLLRFLHTNHPNIRCVLLSGHEDFQFAQRALRLGAYDYLTKPVNFDELYHVFSIIKQDLDRELHKNPDDPSPLHSNCLTNSILQYIQTHYTEELTLNTLSQTFFLHPAYLSKLFKEKTGKNFLEYLTTLRINQAKKLLHDPTLKIYDISQMVGYSNPRHFSKLFKNILGLNPSQYRDTLFLEIQTTDFNTCL